MRNIVLALILLAGCVPPEVWESEYDPEVEDFMWELYEEFPEAQIVDSVKFIELPEQLVGQCRRGGGRIVIVIDPSLLGKCYLQHVVVHEFVHCGLGLYNDNVHPTDSTTIMQSHISTEMCKWEWVDIYDDLHERSGL